MLEKELAQAVKLAQRANKEVSKLKANLLREAEKAVRTSEGEVVRKAIIDLTRRRLRTGTTRSNGSRPKLGVMER